MLVPTSCAACETLIKGSRFLAEAFPVESQGGAREKIREQKKKHADATHVCHAFVLGKNAEVMGMSDDGEPGGTAGRPMLDILKGRGVTNILVTVTRWFGGTLLGTGGLVRAYAGGAKDVLERCGLEELVEKTAFSLSCGYPQHQIVRRALDGFPVAGLSESFAERVSLIGKIPATDFSRLAEAVFRATNGQVRVEAEPGG